MKTNSITKAAITAIGGYVPPYRRTNRELEKVSDTSDEWIVRRTGIKERRILAEELATSDMIVPAIQELIHCSGISYTSIDGLIVATCTPDMPMPSTASIVCGKLGLKHIFAFDINAACTGFLYALSLGRALIESGQYKNILVAGADKMSSVTDIQDRSTNILFGDGAGAVLLQASPGENGSGIIGSIEEGNGEGAGFLNIPAGGSLLPASGSTLFHRSHYIRQQGQVVFKNSVEKMTNVCTVLLEKYQIAIPEIDWLVPHQANLRIIKAVGAGLGIDNAKVLTNIEYFGNTTAASIPLCLWDHQDKFQKGDLILLTAFGAGFNWGAMLIRW